MRRDGEWERVEDVFWRWVSFGRRSGLGHKALRAAHGAL